MLVFERCVLPEGPSIAIVEVVRAECPEDRAAERLEKSIRGFYFFDIGW